ncbi:MAG TPA: glutamine amidotransferase [Tepidisphaeraceae bacterium]|nr:glutamine amidotransferase [Tepidisphaeraceae bacterium]
MSVLSALVWGAAGWLAVAAPLAVVLLVLLAWGYRRAGASSGVRALAVSLKIVAIVILALCLLEPLLTSNRARPGANLFIILADNSQSMTLRDQGADQTRAQQVRALLPAEAKWLVNLRQVFDLRQYAFDTQLKPFAAADDLIFDGGASNLGATLDRIARRYQGRPLAGVLLMTDGSATDAVAVTRFLEQAKASANGAARIPPIYPVLLGSENAANDVSVGQVSVTQTSFEDAPVTVTAQVTTRGYKGHPLVANLLDESGKTVEKQTITAEADGMPISVRFRVRPEQPGVSFYRVAIAPEGKAAAAPPTTQDARKAKSDEATLANNSRLVAVDRGRGPYRVLYVSGRPNWEFKFLQRSLQHDQQVQLLGLLRIAKREPKFSFLGHGGGRGDGDANPLFRGFDPAEKDAVEQYDQPVIVRLGTLDEHELRGGFPKTAEELFRYHAVVLDDLEAEFFTQDQMQLLKEFVRQRGGGLLMLGGQESFKNGKYERTPIGDMLPVYLDQVAQLPPDARFRMQLTREGMLEPWVRLRSDEDAERKRLSAMPVFETVNPIRGIRPGATVLATAQIEGGANVPALVEQRFGQGRVGALLVGDLWRWGLRRPADGEFDMEKSWRQTIRRLVADVPERVGLMIAPSDHAEDQEGTLKLTVAVRDAAHAPLDNAAVTVRVTGPDGKSVDLTAEPSARESGMYEAAYVPRQPGAYRVQAMVAAADGSEVGNAATGWTSDPAAEEFRDLKPNRALLEQLAGATGGQTVEAAKIEPFVATLPTRHAQITEPHIRPAWHQPWVFALATVCLCAEWGLRRWKGMP